MAAEEQQEQRLGLDEVWGIFLRRKWWLVVPLGIGLVTSVVLAFALPAEFEAASTIVVEDPGIPDELARSTITASTESRYENLRLQILARDNMSAVIDDFELYRDDVQNTPREELIDRLRDRIAIEPLPPAIVDPRKPVELNSFSVGLRWPNADVAAAVANRLTRDFISANLKDRASLAEGASEFITTELTKMRTQRADIAQQITDYKENFQGELPEQLDSNRSRLDQARWGLADAEAKLERSREQILQLRSAIEEMRQAAVSSEDHPAQRKATLELQLNQLLAQGLTEKHPDVIALRQESENLDVMIENLEKNPAPVSTVEVKLRNDLRDYEVEAQVFASEIERHKADIAEYEQRIENTPRRAAELDHLVTQYANYNDAIAELQLKKVEADMGRTIELANKGERFRIVESAVPPTAPVSPNRPLLIIVGLALGGMLGMGLLILRELADSSFHSVNDLQQTIGLPVLAAVPVIELAAERARRRLRLRRFGGSAVADV